MLALYVPALAAAALLLHALYTMHPSTVASSSRPRKARVAKGCKCIPVHGTSKKVVMVKESKLAAVPHTCAPCSRHERSNKGCCCSFSFVCWLKHCGISLKRNAAAASDFFAHYSIVVSHSLSRDRLSTMQGPHYILK